ncbi:SRPBCC domain-containing protein [Flavobacterium caeni]|uniref:SRPBCC domain-containing protein n=1 Tax=Flavobacterium caeni TaxID=490189 RepID=UPI000AF0E529|nr:SRPBCC domain-containing protein [Flavobacterium caeni]
MDDGRTAEITFTPQGDQTHIRESFVPENQNPEQIQRDGWQAILDNFKKYTEAN